VNPIQPMTRATDAQAMATLLQGTRALLRATTVEEVVETCCSVVRTLGGTVGPARLAEAGAIPLDLSFGHGEPLLAAAPTTEVLQLLEAVIPDLVEDARVAVAGVRRTGRLEAEATVDGLTGLLNRRSIDRVLARITSGDVVVLLDLDHFKLINDQFGHAAGDVVLTAFARVLREQGRARDWLGRFGGDEFVTILPDGGPAAAATLLDRIRTSWAVVRPQPISFSAGIATADGADADEVLARADEALYHDKEARRSGPLTLVDGAA